MDEQLIVINSFKESPVKRHNALSHKRLWDKQIEVLWSVRNNKRTAVKSGNTVGKTHIAADVVIDWMVTKGPQAKVITTAPTWDQVEGLLWKEIRTSVSQSKQPLGGELLNVEWKITDEWFARGISTNKTERMQGWHSPHLLVVLDEAPGVMLEIWDTVEALHPERILAIGNPLEASGKFYDCWSNPLWSCIRISCEECVEWQEKNGIIEGLVTREWIEDQKEQHGTNSPWYQIHVAGEFPYQTPDTLISREWVEKCRKIKPADLEDDEENEIKLISVDVATKHGESLTVIGYRYGHSIIELAGYSRQSITDSANRVSLKYNQKQADTVITDSDGVGEGLSDILAERKISNFEFHGGSASKAMDDKKFKNLRSQFYWLIAKKFEKGLYSLSELPDKEYDILKNQLCAIHTKAPDPLGRFQIETKDDMMARGVKSPDYADDFMMSEYGFYMMRYADIQAYKFR